MTWSQRRVSSTRLVRLISALTVLIALLAPAWRSAPVAAQDDPASLDLAAMSLRPEDTRAEGIEDIALSGGILTDDPAAAADFLWRFREDEDDVGAEALEEASPDRTYILDLLRPSRPGDVSSGTEQRVISYLFAFADDDAAEAAFEVLSDAWQNDEMEEASTDVEIGDERILVIGTGRDTGNGAGFDRSDLLFRVDAIVAGVSAETFRDEPVEQDQLEALAEQQAERIEDVLEDEGPGLSGLVVRLDVPGRNALIDFYSVRDGEALWQTSETAAALEERQATFADGGILDQYRIEQQVLGEAFIDPSETPLSFFLMRLVRLEDEDAASENIEVSVEGLAEGGAEDLEEVEDAPDIGDEARAFTYRHTRDDGVAFDDYRLYVRVGADVFSLAFNTTEELDVAALDEIAELQAACLTGEESCVDSVRVPRELR